MPGRGRLGPVWEPVCGSKGSESTQIDPDQASYNLQVQPHELLPEANEEKSLPQQM